MPNDCKDNQENGLDVIMPKYDWENRKYDDGTYTFLWSMPRLDKRKDIYRCVLRGDCLSVKDGKVEITIPHQQYTDAEYQRRIKQILLTLIKTSCEMFSRLF